MTHRTGSGSVGGFVGPSVSGHIVYVAEKGGVMIGTGVKGVEMN